MDAIELEYQIELADYLAAHEDYWQLEGRGSRNTILIGLMGIGIACLMGWQLNLGLSTLVLVFFLALPLAYWWLRRYQVIRHYNLEIRFNNSAKSTFHDAGIHCQTPDQDSRFEWTYFSRFAETSGYFLIYHGHNSFMTIPKQALRSIDKEPQFRDLLTRKLGKPATLQDRKAESPAE